MQTKEPPSCLAVKSRVDLVAELPQTVTDQSQSDNIVVSNEYSHGRLWLSDLVGSQNVCPSLGMRG